MNHIKKILAVALVTVLASFTSWAQTVVIQAETIYTSAEQGVISNGVIVISDGKITAVGPASTTAVPKTGRVVKASIVTPGLIDSHTMVGVNGQFNVSADQDASEISDPMGAEYRIMDSYNSQEALIGYVRKLGVTTMHVTPGDNAPVAGMSAIFKTRMGTVENDMLDGEAAMIFNLGNNPKRTFSSKGIRTRMGVSASIRAALAKAKMWGDKPEDKRSSDLGMTALHKVLTGEVKAVFNADREDDIATALRIADEFGFTAHISYGTEGYLMRDQLTASKGTVITNALMQRQSGLEHQNTSLEAPRLYAEAGVPFVFSTGFEGYVPKSRVLLWEMAIAVANGLGAEAAIKAATIAPARLWGINDQVGSLEVGKDADIVLFDGDPFEYSSHVTHVFLDGTLVSEGPN